MVAAGSLTGASCTSFEMDGMSRKSQGYLIHVLVNDHSLHRSFSRARHAPHPLSRKAIYIILQKKAKTDVVEYLFSKATHGPQVTELSVLLAKWYMLRAIRNSAQLVMA
jgi:hypothetical protein